MKDLLTDPASFFERAVDEGGTWTPMIVLVVAGLAYSLQAVVLLSLLGDRLSDFETAAYVSVFGDFSQPFLVWALFLLVVGALSMPLGARLDFRRFVTTSAWAFVPLVATGPFWAVGRYLALRDVPVPPAPNVSGFPGENQRINEYLAALGGDTVYLVFRGLGLVFVLLSFYLMVYAVVACSRLDRRKAAIAVSPAAVIYLLIAT